MSRISQIAFGILSCFFFRILLLCEGKATVTVTQPPGKSPFSIIYFITLHILPGDIKTVISHPLCQRNEFYDYESSSVNSTLPHVHTCSSLLNQKQRKKRRENRKTKKVTKNKRKSVLNAKEKPVFLHFSFRFGKGLTSVVKSIHGKEKLLIFKLTSDWPIGQLNERKVCEGNAVCPCSVLSCKL